MSKRRIEDVINDVLKGDTQKNALALIAHLRAGEDAEKFPIIQHDEKDEGGWDLPNLGFIFVTGAEDFPGPWTMWVNGNNIGEGWELPIDESIKEFAWAHVSPCGSCGGECSPGTSTKVFGKDFENVCQHNLMFTNPDAEAVDYMKKILDIRKKD